MRAIESFNIRLVVPPNVEHSEQIVLEDAACTTALNVILATHPLPATHSLYPLPTLTTNKIRGADTPSVRKRDI